MKLKKANVELRALEIFSVVAQSESLTEAGEALGITQSAVSQAIKQLEAHTGAELVIRRRRPTKLTPAGKILQDYASRILTEGQRMLTDIQMASGKGLAQISVGMIDSLGAIISEELVRRIKPLAGKVLLRTGVSAPLSSALLSRDLDILFTSDPMDSSPEIARFPLLRDPFLILAPESCKPKGDAPVHKWLARYVPFVRYTRDTRIGVLTDLIARRLEIQLTTHYDFDSTETLLRFVQAGHGWSIVTGLCIAHYPKLLEGTRVIPLANGAHARYISLLCHRHEFGDLPETIANISREICTKELLPSLRRIAPWLDRQSYILSELPII
jgi:DNA-binding transcriptional LysR family regulator